MKAIPIFISFVLLICLLFGYTNDCPRAQFIEQHEFGFLLTALCLVFVSLCQLGFDWIDG